MTAAGGGERREGRGGVGLGGWSCSCARGFSCRAAQRKP